MADMRGGLREDGARAALPGPRVSPIGPPAVEDSMRSFGFLVVFPSLDQGGSRGVVQVDATSVSGCVKARINGEQWSPLPAVCGAGDDSERWVGV